MSKSKQNLRRATGRLWKFFSLIVLLFLLIPSLAVFATTSTNQTDSISSIDSSHKVYVSAIQNAKDDSLQQLGARFQYGEFLESEGDLDGSIEQFGIALRIAINIENHEQIATIANYLARDYWMTGHFEASIETYKTALSSAEIVADSSDIAKISMNLGNNYNYLGDYDSAIKYALNALRIKETAEDWERICYHYISMGNIFRENSIIDKWEEYVWKAYHKKDQEGCASTGDLAKIYNSLGGIAVQKEEYPNALLFYDTLLMISQEAGFLQGINSALSNSAGVYNHLGQYQKALDMATQAEDYSDGNPYDQIFSNNLKAELNQLLGNYSIALELVKENMQGEEIQYYSTEKVKCLLLLYELNLATENYADAFRWNDSLRTTENQLRDENVRETIEDLERKYENEKKEQQIELLTAENKIASQRMRISWLFIAVLFVLIVLGILLLRFRRKQAAYRHSELQQQLLRSQMSPHFIFNVMGSIQSYLYKNEARKAADYLSRFAKLSRSVLEFSTLERITLSQEIEMLQNYIELERARMAKPFDVEYCIHEDLESEFIEIPPMLLQPFVENAIKHGLQNLEYQGKLRLCFDETADYINVEIEDNGHGLRINKSKNHKSKALEIFHERKRGIEQKCKKELTFEMQNLNTIDKAKQGVRVGLRLPILNND